MTNELREIVDELEDIEFGIASFKLFKPVIACWRAFVRACQPLFDFHDKYIIYILWAVLLGGTALTVGWVYWGR